MPVFQVNVVQLIYLYTNTGVLEQVHLRLQTAQGVGERSSVSYLFPVFTGKSACSFLGCTIGHNRAAQRLHPPWPRYS